MGDRSLRPNGTLIVKTELRQYQVEARDAAIAVLTMHGGGFMLIPEQRTGKTVTALSIVEQLRTPTLLVACPKVAMPVWKEAIKHEFKGKRNWLGEVVILNYEQFVSNRKNWYKWADKHRNQFFMICDESHVIKSRGSARSTVIRVMSRRAKYRLALTGTPIANGLEDAWAQFNFINPSVFGKFDNEVDDNGEIVKLNFDGTYLVWGGYKNHQIVGYRNKKKFYEKFHQFSYRITLREAKKQGGVDPLKLQMVRAYVDLCGKSREHYDRMLQKLVTVVNGKKVKVKNVISCIVKLQQICGGSLLVPEPENFGHTEVISLGREKLDKLHEIVRSLRSRSKFVVIARYVHELERIDAFLQRLGYTTQVVRGGQPFDGKFACDAVIMQIQSGMAVDMSKADDIVFYSTDYSYLNFEQARFRILSYAKTFARYHFLLARDTIDEQIFEAVTRKKNLAKLVIDTYRRVRK